MNAAQIGESLYWHDGVLSKFECFVADISKVSLVCELYEDAHASQRQCIELNFLKINDLNFSVDCLELINNRGAGNISHAYVKPNLKGGAYKLFIYFVDGYLSFSFEDVSSFVVHEYS